VAAHVQPPGIYWVNCFSHPKSHNINMILGHILLDEIWGAKVERKILKSNSAHQLISSSASGIMEPETEILYLCTLKTD
jgi:hypothetical protein